MSDWQRQSRTRRIIWMGLAGAVAAAVIASIAVPLLLASQQHPLNGQYNNYYSHPPFFFLWPFHFGWLGGIVLIFIIFWVARWLLFWPRRGGSYFYRRQYPQEAKADAVSIVRERYAKGEITKEQFEQMLHDLRQGDQGP